MLSGLSVWWWFCGDWLCGFWVGCLGFIVLCGVVWYRFLFAGCVDVGWVDLAFPGWGGW